MRTRLLLALSILAASAAPANALRCGTSLVVEGQSKYDVLQRCGQPSYTDGHMEFRTTLPNFTTPRPLDSFDQSIPYPYTPQVQREVYVEEWVYNFGSTQLMEALTFENGVLIRIRTLGYGR